MKTPFPSGLFIVIDGARAAGKTTHATLLAQYFRSKGLLCTICRETGEVDVQSQDSFSAESEGDAWLRDHQNHSVGQDVAAMLAQQGIIIVERSPLKGARNWQGAVTEYRRPDPDITIILDIPPAVANDRIAFRGESSNQADEPQSVSEETLGRSGNDPKEPCKEDKDAVVIDSTSSTSEVAGLVRAAVVRKGVEKIATETELNAASVNDVIQLLENDEDIWGLWPDLDEILGATVSPTRGGTAADLDDPNIIPLPS